MIRDISVHAKPSNNNAKLLFYILLVLTAASTVVYLAIERYKGVVGLVALVFVTALVFVYNKYLSSKYYYDVTTDSLGSIFVVRQVIGKRQSTLCKISLSGIVKITKETAEERRAHKTPAEYRKYVYTPTLSPKTGYRITSVSRYEKAEIVVEISDEFAALLSEYAEEARNIEMISEDE